MSESTSSSSQADKEKLFSLQLTIHKLEEELQLYRNGTTSENLFELLGEKETEIEDLKNQLNDKTDKLRRVAKGSADVLAKCESLQQEREALLKREKELLMTQEELEKLLEMQPEQLLEKPT